MGLLNRVGLHFQEKYALTQVQAMKVADDATKNAPVPIQLLGMAVGIAAGTAIGAVRLANPSDIYDSLLTPEEDIEDRMAKKGKSLGV